MTTPSFDDDYVPPGDADVPSDTADYAEAEYAEVEVYDPAPPASSDVPVQRERRGYKRREAAMASTEFRQPPHDAEAEQGVLGAMLLSPQTVIDTVELLVAEDFYRPAHQLIFEAIVGLFSDNKEIDPVIVAARLDRNNDLERVGGAPYLHTLISSVPTAANARYYAEIVAEKSLLRQLVNAGTRVVQLGYEGTEGAEVESVIDRAQQEVFKVSKKNQAEDYAVLADIVGPTMDEIDMISENGGLAQGVPTGFVDLDNLTNGLHGGQMIIVAARPGVGKSTIALDFVRSCAIKHDKAAVIFSLEMSKSEIVMRLLSAEAEVKLSDMRSGRLDDSGWAKLATRVGQIEQAPIYIDDSANLTMMEIRSKARRLKQKHDLQMIVVDYLQLMSSGKRVESRQQEVSEFSRQLKLLAKELDVPLIAISQLNRGPESRTDKRPQLADLRESGSLEQDADMVMLLYRPDSQDRENERAGEADIILAKHRGGPIDTIQVAHQLHYSRFVDMPHAG
ncbi:replicative DNA helicase [Corynebacterium diphtheriae]|uniref:Replicative DNA helicase n=1 Tax=Corynebacterium diphtheriae TaxID=1717 RepID=A0A6J4WL80_CORDP|nr:replicative DNA helicase [Corynebacterium diphtheriae]OWN10660.1 replicative DNA helicase [Corynebacterium belfantii]AEX42976.1 replicative DNA helicase [Corynebacterium diphtheriae 31A]AEX79892.1 replicative DNA helicase [Corynebacterium diphtheriae HC03]KJJ59236.1 helicase DnaB [Corynebacterium diphtheriae]KLN36934.1 DNA helicase [Corynebacterium diphtheriae bv. gravis str. ISS 4060]